METVRNALDQLSIDYDEEKIDKLLIFYNEIIESSKNFNLTALKSWEEIRDSLFIRSMRYANIINTKYFHRNFFGNKELKIMDLGTGAGIPSIPMKIFYPDMNLFLAESSQKKCDFLNNISEKLELKGIQVYNQRAEILGQSKHRETFDLILTRALAKLPTLAELTIPLLNIGGVVITAKGEYPIKEIEDSIFITKMLGVSKNITENIKIPKFLPEDNFIIWEKTKISPREYPRRDGMPKKKPIVK